MIIPGIQLLLSSNLGNFFCLAGHIAKLSGYFFVNFGQHCLSSICCCCCCCCCGGGGGGGGGSSGFLSSNHNAPCTV